MVAGGLKIRKGDAVSVSMLHLCNNKSEWIDPEKFLPERFDPKSPLSLTPKGTKRNPFSFSPYLGGMRICLGKTFVENVSKVILPSLLHTFKFESPSTKEMPHNNMLCTFEPEVRMMLTRR